MASSAAERPQVTFAEFERIGIECRTWTKLVTNFAAPPRLSKLAYYPQAVSKRWRELQRYWCSPRSSRVNEPDLQGGAAIGRESVIGLEVERLDLPALMIRARGEPSLQAPRQSYSQDGVSASPRAFDERGRIPAIACKA